MAHDDEPTLQQMRVELERANARIGDLIESATDPIVSID